MSVFLFAATASLARADNAKIFGLPATATTSRPPDSANASASNIMGLPASTQWTVERTKGYLYLSYNTAQMQNSSIKVGTYSSSFSGTDFGYPSFDYFANLLTFAAADSRSFVRDLSLWGRYGLGFADRQGQLTNSATPLSSLEKSSLLIFSAKLGLVLGWERSKWLRPYLGIELDPYYYRLTSDISSAEMQAGGFGYGPVVGLHLPLFFKGTGSIMAEYRRNFAVDRGNQILSTTNNFDAGLGLTF